MHDCIINLILEVFSPHQTCPARLALLASLSHPSVPITKLSRQKLVAILVVYNRFNNIDLAALVGGVAVHRACHGMLLRQPLDQVVGQLVDDPKGAYEGAQDRMWELEHKLF